MRRDKNDARWKQLKEAAYARDGGDRIWQVLNCTQAAYLRQALQNHPMEVQLTCAHIIAVGDDDRYCYDLNNVVMLNAFSHHALDNCCSPVTGNPIDKSIRDLWWWKIAGKQQCTAIGFLPEGRPE